MVHIYQSITPVKVIVTISCPWEWDSACIHGMALLVQLPGGKRLEGFHLGFSYRNTSHNECLVSCRAMAKAKEKAPRPGEPGRSGGHHHVLNFSLGRH